MTQQVRTLYQQLSARERALLAIRHTLDGTPEPLALRAQMPEWQIYEFNGYLGRANAVWRVLGPYTVMLYQELEVAELRLSVLRLLVLRAEEQRALYGLLWPHVRELVIESEREARIAEMRAEVLPLRDAVEVVAAERGLHWESEAQWDQLAASIVEELRTAAREQALPAHGQGDRLSFEYGELCDWLGAEVRAFSDVAPELQVVPDSQQERAARSHKDLSLAQEAIASGRIDEEILRGDGDLPADVTSMHRTVRALARRVRSDARRLAGELMALEAAYQELTDWLGEDVATPEQRSALTGARGRLDRLVADAAELLGPFADAAADAEYLTLLRDAIATEAAR